MDFYLVEWKFILTFATIFEKLRYNIIIQNTNIVSSPQMLRILSRSGCLGA